MGESHAAVLLERVAKRFDRGGRSVEALHAVSLSLRRGELALLRGDNGAGKTTLLRVVAGLVEPDAGEVRVLGRPLAADRERLQRSIGWCSSDERSAYPRLSGRENLRLFAALQGLDRRAAARRVSELDGILGLGDALDIPFQACSSGQRQRIAIARALLHEPEILLFDEPARSLDPATRAAFADHVRDLATREGRLVVVAGHALDDLRPRADRSLELRAGSVAADGGPRTPRRGTEDPPGSAPRPARGTNVVLALARRDRLIFQSYRSQLVVKLCLLAVWLVTLYYVSALVDTSSPKVAPYLTGDYFRYALLGFAFLRISQVSLVQMAGALRDEQLQGTVEPLFATGTRPILLVLGGLVWPIAVEVAGLALVFGVGSIALGIGLSSVDVPALVCAALATIAATAVWGILSVAYVIAFQRGDPVALLVNLITIGLSGAYFPVEMVPAWARPLSNLLPLRWGLDAIRAAALRGEGFGSPAYRKAMLALAGLVAVILPLSGLAFRAAVRRALRKGTLAQS
jgi:ABC-type multidrug transport system ATPase subunit/ABC-type multidrug transport system permease subunit